MEDSIVICFKPEKLLSMQSLSPFYGVITFGPSGLLSVLVPFLNAISKVNRPDISNTKKSTYLQKKCILCVIQCISQGFGVTVRQL